MQQVKHRRKIRNYLLAPAYQLRYSLWLTLTGLALVAAFCVLAFSYLKENYDSLIQLCPMTGEAKTQLLGELRSFTWQLGAISLLFLLLTGALGIWFSHRTVGPIYHLRRVMREVATGKKSARVRLRSRDELKELSADFNAMLDALEKM